MHYMYMDFFCQALTSDKMKFCMLLIFRLLKIDCFFYMFVFLWFSVCCDSIKQRDSGLMFPCMSLMMSTRFSKTAERPLGWTFEFIFPTFDNAFSSKQFSSVQKPSCFKVHRFTYSYQGRYAYWDNTNM